MSEHLGKTLKALRLMRGLNQQAVADRVGMSRTSITNIEAGRQTLTDKTLAAIARALGHQVFVSFRRIDKESGRD